MDILLLRHGQAEESSAGVADANRKLTEAGRRAMYASLTRSLNLLSHCGRVYIWTSPLIRARQTAEIAAECLCNIRGGEDSDAPVLSSRSELEESGKDHILSAIARFLGRNEEEELVRWLPEEPSSERNRSDDILFLVGHDPQISELGAFFTGVNLHFQKGALMCFRLTDRTISEVQNAASAVDARGALAGAGRMKWFVQGPVFRQWETLTELETILTDGFARVKKLLGRFRKCQDAESVHDLRVSIRTLRSCVAFIKPFQKQKQNRRMQKKLRAIVIQLSRLREYDVLLEKAGSSDLDSASAGDGGPAEGTLEDVLTRCRRQECRRVLSVFSREESKDLLQSLERDFQHIRWADRVLAEGMNRSELAERMDDVTNVLSDVYRTLNVADADAAHSARKFAKKVRYAAKNMEPLIGDRGDVVAEMKRIQDDLGALCDARVNVQILEDFVRRSGFLPETARRQAEKLAAEQREEERRLMDRLTGSAQA